MKKGLRILVGNDGSENSKIALWEAISLAKKFSGFIKVLTVYKREDKNKADKILKESEQYLKMEKVEYNLISILGSNPARALINIAKEEKFDLIVVGSRGLGSTISFILGSVMKKVVSDAQCNILVIKK